MTATTTPDTPVRGRPRSAAVDAAIIAAARAVLVEEGSIGFTMAGVAARAGVSTATLYRRYQHREELIVAALTDPADSGAPDTGSIRTDIETMMASSVVKFRGEHGQLVRAVSVDTCRDPVLAEVLRSRLMANKRAGLRRMFKQAVARGEIPEPADIDIVLDMLVAPLVYRVMMSGDPVTPRVGAELARLVLRAIGYVEPA